MIQPWAAPWGTELRNITPQEKIFLFIFVLILVFALSHKPSKQFEKAEVISKIIGQYLHHSILQSLNNALLMEATSN